MSARRSTHSAPTLGWLFVIAWAVATCKDSTNSSVPTFLVVTPAAVALTRFGSASITASVLDQDSAALSGISVAFHSNDTAIATVTALGAVHSSGPTGSTTVVVTAANLTKNVPVTVTTNADAVVVTPVDSTVKRGATYQLRTTVVDPFGDSISGALRTYQATDSSIATVSASGLVTAKTPGHTAFVVTSGSASNDSSGVTVVDSGAVTIIVSPGYQNAQPGETYQLQTTVLDGFGDTIPGAPLTFQSVDTAIATVSASGLVTATSFGFTTFVVTSGSATNADAGVMVVDTAVVARIPLGDAPYGVAASSTGVVYVAPIIGPAVRRVDMTTFVLTDTIAIGGDPAQVAFVGAGATALVTQRAAGMVSIIDVTTHSRVDSILIPGAPYPVRVSADGSTAYVTSTAGWLYKIDIASRTRTDSVSAPDPALQIALGPGDSLLYVSRQLAGTVLEVRTATMTIVRSFLTGGYPQGVAISQDGAELYIADEAGPLRIWDLSSAAQIDSIVTGGSTFGVTLTPDGTKLYVGTTAGLILQIDRVTRTILHPYLVGGTPRNVAVDPVTGLVIVPNEASNEIDIVQ